MKLLLTQDDNRKTFPRHSGGKFNLECNGGSGLLPLPGVGIVVERGDPSALLKYRTMWTRKARNCTELSVLHTGKACLRTAKEKQGYPNDVEHKNLVVPILSKDSLEHDADLMSYVSFLSACFLFFACLLIIKIQLTQDKYW